MERLINLDPGTYIFMAILLIIIAMLSYTIKKEETIKHGKTTIKSSVGKRRCK